MASGNRAHDCKRRSNGPVPVHGRGAISQHRRAAFDQRSPVELLEDEGGSRRRWVLHAIPGAGRLRLEEKGFLERPPDTGRVGRGVPSGRPLQDLLLRAGAGAGGRRLRRHDRGLPRHVRGRHGHAGQGAGQEHRPLGHPLRGRQAGAAERLLQLRAAAPPLPEPPGEGPWHGAPQDDLEPAEPCGSLEGSGEERRGGGALPRRARAQRASSQRLPVCAPEPQRPRPAAGGSRRV
mmetsp:Transcript_79400/g.233283  ORF Transcript_79400/g.233283 Transcript_79400/m.233283 type:complete len:235 (+) Transcript_79400:291-995(+)